MLGGVGWLAINHRLAKIIKAFRDDSRWTHSSANAVLQKEVGIPPLIYPPTQDSSNHAGNAICDLQIWDKRSRLESVGPGLFLVGGFNPFEKY